MTDALFLAGFLVLPLIGSIIWTLPAVQRMDLGGRIAAAGAAGALIVAVLMSLLSLLGISWSRTLLFPIFALIAALGLWRSSRRPDDSSTRRLAPWTFAILTVFAILTIYGLLTARSSAGDLQFFWGPKGIHFFRAGGISVDFLANKANPNSDYPPLVPLLYAWSNLIAHQFSWWSALLTTALFLFGAAFFLRSCAGDEIAVLFAATFSWTLAAGFTAGGADPPLLFFEVIALAALTLIDDPRGRDILTAIGLAGAAFTKIEGATFVIAVVVAMIVVQRSFKRALLVAAPAIVILLGWVTFLIANGLLFGYGGAKMRIYLDALPSTILHVAKLGSYELFWLPWVFPIILLALGRARGAALPLLVAALTLGTTVFFYIHLPEPGWWIDNSAARVLLTPLAALFVAAAVATRRPIAP